MEYNGGRIDCPPKAPTEGIDHAMDRLVDEIERAKDLSMRIHALLEAPQPQEGKMAQDCPHFVVLTDAINYYAERLNSMNRLWEVTAKRLSEQVGNLKILA